MKTWREIFPEKYPSPDGAPTVEELEAACREAVTAARIGILSLDKIDQLLEANRTGDYRVRYANFLSELRELTAAQIDPEAVEMFLDWRVDRLREDDGSIRRRPETWRRYGNWSDDDLAAAQAKWDAETQKSREQIDVELERAPRPLRPHWLVQRGAAAFRRGDFTRAAEDFDAVRAENPDNPRAEVALVMRARCAIELSREAVTRSQKSESFAFRREAWDLLRSYEDIFPAGRFLADVIGWQGALESDAGDFGAAIKSYLRQIDVKPTQEVIRSALRECDRCFTELLDRRALNQLPVKEIARHPAAAMSLVYHCLDNGARRDFERGFSDDFSGGREILRRIEERVVRPREDATDMLLRLGREVATGRGKYDTASWRNFYLSILAWVAIENGEYEQAVLIAQREETSPISEDLVLCRSVALERSGRYEEALAGYRELSERDPTGALAVDLPYRITMCLRQLGQGGEAAAEIQRLLAPNSGADADAGPRFPVLRLEGEVEQWADALLQFAPLPELEAALTSGNLAEAPARRIRSMIRCRALAREDFPTAERWLEPEIADPKPEYFALENWAAMDRNRWREYVEPVRQARLKVQDAINPQDQADALIALGSQWELARGKITAPSLDPRGIFGSESEIADLQRRKNARLLGLDFQQASEELDRRDEMWHALQAYLAAASLPSNDRTRATALAAANRCLFRMAELTPYQADRSVELGHSELSRGIFRRLRAEYPGSPQAREAIFYTFEVGPERGPWMPGNYAPWISELAIANSMSLQNESYSENDQPRRAAVARLQDLAGRAGEIPVENIRSELASIRQEFLPHFKSANDAGVINDLDDLELFMAAPGVTPQMRADYFRWRLARRVEGVESTAWAPAADFLSFLRNIQPLPDTQGYRPTLTNDTVAGWEEFLQKYPESPKAEAARLRMARLIYRTYRTRVGVQPFFWPESPIWNGYKRVVVKRGQPFNQRRVLAALDEYDRLHPDGHYAAEVKLMRGGAAIESGDYRTALNCLTAVLDDPAKRDLHLDASLELAELFLRLLNDHDRPKLLAAFASVPRSRVYLDRFIDGDTCGARLRPLRAFINEFAAKQSLPGRS